ncbi:helix-turn-helix domain-containing protein [Streptomyces sp. 378]|uniref:helix-turn-helix transcriptional regulator n=1 Tax=Streptomyces sp. 378 TaxID=3049412 RepID=UPI0024C41D92|nr:helix-turn-helix domain-containing protein [Streptomyces sp. 378]MDK1348011.1 helix-turn-helix domain-containing protein [Streptomyces sp. 378]
MSRSKQAPASGSQRRPLATAQEVAEYLGVPVATVYNWKYRGDGPKFIKVGRHLRARWEDVEAYLEQQTGR